MNKKAKFMLTTLAATALLSGCAAKKQSARMSIEDATIAAQENCAANHNHENIIDQAYCIYDAVEKETGKQIELVNGPGLHFKERGK